MIHEFRKNGIITLPFGKKHTFVEFSNFVLRTNNLIY
jgi:hypothetical protein